MRRSTCPRALLGGFAPPRAYMLCRVLMAPRTEVRDEGLSLRSVRDVLGAADHAPLTRMWDQPRPAGNWLLHGAATRRCRTRPRSATPS